ncbi:MAG: 4a-hydroxytetrahydrobiopterin dehydratase [bacterium]|nr:4a-hydroxytetrahydrobiopterin dehydratase [bacterium]
MNDETLEVVSTEEARLELEKLGPGWTVTVEGHLSRLQGMPNFSAGLKWVNQIGEVAEELNHHPDIYLSFKQVRLDLYSHKLEGLCQADFTLAHKIDQLDPH